MTRPAFYFKLHGNVRIAQNVVDGAHFTISGQIMRRRSKWLPSWLDDGVMFVCEQYTTPDAYKEALLILENKAFMSCENLCAQEEKILSMIEMHDTNLRKLNLGYKLIGWFRGMGNTDAVS